MHIKELAAPASWLKLIRRIGSGKLGPKAVMRILRVMKKDSRIQAQVQAFQESLRGKTMSARETEFKLEFIVPTYNHAPYLQQCLESLPPGIPITVVDDASTDNTSSVLDELSKRISFKRLRNETNQLQGGSINRAVAESDNNTFIVMNADDVMLRRWPACALELLRTHESVRMISGTSIPFVGGLPPIDFDQEFKIEELLRNTRVYGPQDAKYINHIHYFRPTFSGILFLRSAWEYVGGLVPFSDRVCSADDRDFQMRVCCFFDCLFSEHTISYARSDSSTGRGQD